MQTEESKQQIKNSVGRAIVVAVSVLLQIAWIMVTAQHLLKNSEIFNTIVTLLGWVVALHIYARNMNSAYKFSWIILVLMFPVLGLSMYLFFGSQFSNLLVRKFFESREGVRDHY